MTEWRKAGESPRPMMARAAAEVQPLAQVVGDIPDEHVITVAERRVSVDYQTIIQNNMNTDTVDLVLDGEWDGMSVVCYIGHPGDLSEFEWDGTPFTLPVYDTTGSIDVTVVGLSADGRTRLVTVEAKGVMNVIKSGEFEGSVPPEDQPDLLGQILAAKGDAEDAADAANSAAATANSAASSANSAASSANSAATSANSAATKANSAAVDAQNAYDTLQPYMATIDSCANILHREVGPDSVVTADDSFPCKPVEMTVYGNTRQNLWVNPSGTAYGITSTSNEDGTLTLSGTCTSTAYIAILVKYVYNVKPNTTYTASIDKMFKNDGNTAENYIRLFLAFGSSDNVWDKQDGFSPGSRTSFQFTTTSTTNRLVFGLQVYGNPSGVSVSGTYRVMLNEGSEAQPWCPPGLNSVGDDGSVDIVTAGKNLLARMGPSLPYTTAGITFSDNGDSGIRINGTATEAAYYNFFSNSPAKVTRITPGEYTASLIGGGSGLNLSVEYFDGGIGGSRTSWLATNVPGVSNTGSIDRPVYLRPFLSVAKGKTVDTVVYPQLELGSTATDYEPPNITTTTIDLQDHTLNALPDGTRDELHIDGGGNVVLEKRVGKTVVNGTTNKFTTWGDKTNKTYAYGPIGDNSKSAYNIMSDKLAVATQDAPVQATSNRIQYASANLPNNIVCASVGTDLDTANAWMQSNNTTVLFPLATPQTISLGTITPPTMAAPNVTAYVADDTPAEIELDYVRDINVVVDRLEKKVAGTAATVAINEATR